MCEHTFIVSRDSLIVISIVIFADVLPVIFVICVLLPAFGLRSNVFPLICCFIILPFIVAVVAGVAIVTVVSVVAVVAGVSVVAGISVVTGGSSGTSVGDSALAVGAASFGSANER